MRNTEEDRETLTNKETEDILKSSTSDDDDDDDAEDAED